MKNDSTKYALYEIAGITLKIESDIPITDNTFNNKLDTFRVDSPGEDVFTINHHFGLPPFTPDSIGIEKTRIGPWAIFNNNDFIIYVSKGREDKLDLKNQQVMVIPNSDSKLDLYQPEELVEHFADGQFNSLTIMPSDQIFLARLLATRGGCYLHSAGIKINNRGLLFVGHSDAGKSTISSLLSDYGKILCDDRMIVRKWPDEFKIHGTWHHGDVPDISHESAPLNAMLFLEQSEETRLVPVDDRQDSLRRILPCLIKAYSTSGWWDKTLSTVESIVAQTKCYIFRFCKDKSASEAILNFIEDQDE